MTTKYKLVPIEPTEEMVNAMFDYWKKPSQSLYDAFIGGYKAMLEAVQESEPVAIKAQPLQWSGDKDEWMDKRWGMHISLDEGEYSACWGEGDTETFKTLEEAKHWCQLEADGFIESVACYTHPPADKDAERYRWLMKNADWFDDKYLAHIDFDNPQTITDAIDEAMKG